MSLKKYIIKPLGSNLLMGIVAYVSYTVIMKLTQINLIAVGLSIGIAALFYLIVILKLKVLTNDEIEQLPAGTVLVKAFKKFKLIN